MLNALITYLNTLINTGGLIEYQYGLTQIVTYDGVSFPAEYNPDTSEYVNVSTGLDDYDSVSYWRLNGEVSTGRHQPATSIYSAVQHTYPLRLVLIVKRSSLDASTQYTADAIVWNIQKQLSNQDQAIRRELEAKRVELLLADADVNNASVYSGEYPGGGPALPDSEYILVAINMTVAVAVNDACIEALCNDIEAPTDLVATISADVSGEDAVLIWNDASDNETGFRIYRSASYTGPYSILAETAADVETYTDEAPAVDTVWYYRVRAFNASASSEYSNVAAAMTSSGITLTVNGESAYGAVYDDLDVVIVDSTGSEVSSYNSLSGNVVADGSVSIKSHLSTLIATVATRAERVFDHLLSAVTLTVTDQNGNALSSSSEEAGVNLTKAVTVYNTASEYKTGQTTSYAANDDGDLELGRGASFSTLSFNNPFGDTSRFTDTAGGQTYSNNIVIDWSTWVQADRVVTGWYRTQTITKTWAEALSESAALSTGGFTSGWSLPNVNVFTSIYNYGQTGQTNYAPFNFSGSGNSGLWTGTTNPSNTDTAIVSNNSVTPGVRTKTQTASWVAIRRFTLTELGL